MIKPLKALSTISAMTVALLASAPASADNQIERVRASATTTAVDKNKDSAVIHVDAQKTGRLAQAQLTDKEIMERTFRIDAGG